MTFPTVMEVGRNISEYVFGWLPGQLFRWSRSLRRLSSVVLPDDLSTVTIVSEVAHCM